ncbi:MAG: NADH-quinone oxidoreductase subunit M [Proteobacteria bacterium]|nr:NADH-quinone oxidoreductase subunit M [Pseudomonadota bacterium]MBS0218122.1 NADH-quinone oxidoreductase subunit M [Pseudomonadota bacterium]
MTQTPILSLLIWLPIFGGALTLLMGKRDNAARWLAIAIAAVTLLASLPLIGNFDYANGGLQFVEQWAWIDAYRIQYHLGADGISVALIVLTAITSLLVLIGAWGSVDRKVNQYYALFLILEGLMIGVFSAQDAILFYAFFEGMLIPMFILIGVWGGPRRVYAAVKFFLYTFLGSVFMLVALVYLYLKAGSWQLADLYALPLTAKEQTWIFFAFLAAFAVKVPMFPVHTWLPDAHVEAPTGGSVILAAIMLKIGGYGFLRFSLPITPDASAEWAWLVITLSLIAVVYVGLVALVQDDMKKLVAYSSVSHMGFVTLGTFAGVLLAHSQGANGAGTQLVLQGAMVQMISHGFVSGAMFSCIGVMYDRMHTRMIRDYGGVANVMPWFAAFVVLFAMANSGLPATSGFVGEFMVIVGVFQQHPLIAFAAATTLVIGAGYTLWLVKRTIWGEVANDHVAEMKDINLREACVLGVFALGVLAIGLYPKPLTDLMAPALQHLGSQIAASKLTGL